MASQARGAYFLVEEGREKCFHENLVQHQVLHMTYIMHDKEIFYDMDGSKLQCKVSLKNPSGEVVEQSTLVGDTHEGALAHAAQVGGTHSACLECKPEVQEWFNMERRKMRWSLTFDVLGTGPGITLDMSKLAKLTHLQPAQEGAELLLQRLSGVEIANGNEKDFEVKFSKASEAVNTDVAAFKLLQIILISAVTAFQIHHLSKFLNKSRLFGCCLPVAQKPMV